MLTDLAPLILVLCALLGLAVGSFLNVVIARVPTGESVIRPASRCPGCGAAISARDNIPLISWLVLRGRCRGCGMRISARYPLVELGTAVIWVLTAWWSLAEAPALLPLLLVQVSFLIALLAIDLEHQRLPDALTLSLYPITVAGLALAWWISDTAEWLSALIGAGIWVVMIGGIWLLSGGRAMGFGDVKLAPVLGATLGWLGIGSSVTGLLLAWVLGGIVGIVLLARGRSRGAALAFGPFLIIGFALGLVVGQPLTDAYLGFLGL